MKNNEKYITKKQKLKIFLMYQLLLFIVSLILYHNWFISYCMSFSIVIVIKNILKKENEKKKREIINEFKNFLNVLSTFIITGDEPCKAFIKAFEEYKNIANNVFLLTALNKSYNYVKVYEDFQIAIKILCDELDIDIVNKFYESIKISYKTYGNISETLINTIELINEKISTENEIKNLFHEKKYEMKIMLLIPILIYLFLSFTASEFINPIYNNVTGYFVITLCLGLLILAYVLGEKILDDDVE